MNERKESVNPGVDLLSSWGEFPIPDLAVNWPQCRVFRSLPVLLGHSDLHRFGPPDFGVKHPNVFDFNPSSVEVAAHGIVGGGLFQPRD